LDKKKNGMLGWSSWTKRTKKSGSLLSINIEMPNNTTIWIDNIIIKLCQVAENI